MNYGLNLKSSPAGAGALDLVSLGALIHRLDPGIVPFRKATHCDIHVSGGEFNVAANLADCFRLKTGIVTAMVDYPIGDLIAERVRAMGVTPFYKRFEHNGVTGPNMASVYSVRGQGVRAPVTRLSSSPLFTLSMAVRGLIAALITSLPHNSTSGSGASSTVKPAARSIAISGSRP